MKALLNRRTIIILSAAVLLAVISIVSVNVFSSSGPVTGVANVITTPVRALVTTVARTFNSIFSAIYEYDELVARNDELNRRIAEMAIDYRESARLAEENAALRQMLDFRDRHGDYEYEMATVDGWSSDNWSSTFRIRIGSANSNIAPGMGVTTEFGVLIGQVYDVGPTQSTVISVLDTRFSAAAYVGRRDTGDVPNTSSVARGDLTQMGYGRLMLDTIDDDIIISIGDMVVTSDIGGVFPSGLILGEIYEIRRHPSNIGRYAYIVPNVNFDTLTNVFVITGFEETER